MPSCKNGSVHLSNGKGDMEGRVEYCFSGEWAAMCSLSSNTAKLICRKYGYEECKFIGCKKSIIHNFMCEIFQSKVLQKFIIHIIICMGLVHKKPQKQCLHNIFIAGKVGSTCILKT